MSEKESHPIRNGLIVTVVGGLILAAIPAVREIAIRVLSVLWSGLVWVWHALIARYPTPGWLLLLLAAFALAALVRLGSVLWLKDEPEHLAYVEDTLYGAVWRWSWVGNNINGLWCFCPSCDAQLVYDDSSCHSILAEQQKTDFICEHCAHRVVATVPGGPRSYAVAAVEREIRRRLRTGEAFGSNTRVQQTSRRVG